MLRGRAGILSHGNGALPPLRARAWTGSQSVMYGQLPILAGLAYQTTITPPASIGSGALPLLQSSGFSYSIGSGAASGKLPSLLGIGHDVPRSWARGILPPLSGFAFASGPIDNLLYAVQSPGFLQIRAVGAVGTRYVQGLGLTGLAQPDWVMLRKAVLGLVSTPPTTLLDGLQHAAEKLGFADVVGIVLRLLMSEKIGVKGTPSAWGSLLLEVRDVLGLLAGPGSLLDARNALVSALGLADQTGFVWPATVLAKLGVKASDANHLTGYQALMDTLGAHAVPYGRATFTALVDDTMGLHDGPLTRADLFTLIRDGLGVLATFHLPDGVHTAWVLHAETQAFTSYTNFPFNSFARFGDRYFGCSDTGIYLLEGPDDAGVPIEARVRLGLEDYGTSALKGAESMYLGYRADGGMLLKVIVTNDAGDLEEHWYALESRPAQEITYGRAKIGRGLRSAYWGFEIANVAGADFSLDGFRWLPLVKDRRIK